MTKKMIFLTREKVPIQNGPNHTVIRYCADIRLEGNIRRVYNRSLRTLAHLVTLNIPDDNDGGITDKIEYSYDISSKDRETFKGELLSRLRKKRP